MSVVDTLIYVKDLLGSQARADLEQRLRDVPGVIAPRFNPGKEHLLLVAYDPAQTTSGFLLEQVRAQGYNGRLVAM